VRCNRRARALVCVLRCTYLSCTYLTCTLLVVYSLQFCMHAHYMYVHLKYMRKHAYRIHLCLQALCILVYVIFFVFNSMWHYSTQACEYECVIFWMKNHPRPIQYITSHQMAQYLWSHYLKNLSHFVTFGGELAPSQLCDIQCAQRDWAEQIRCTLSELLRRDLLLLTVALSGRGLRLPRARS
jgi:hypothetical protein